MIGYEYGVCTWIEEYSTHPFKVWNRIQHFWASSVLCLGNSSVTNGNFFTFFFSSWGVLKVTAHWFDRINFISSSLIQIHWWVSWIKIYSFKKASSLCGECKDCNCSGNSWALIWCYCHSLFYFSVYFKSLENLIRNTERILLRMKSTLRKKSIP